jgi:hypothetical protein
MKTLKDRLQAFPSLFADRIGAVVHDVLKSAAEEVVADFTEGLAEASLGEIVQVRDGTKPKRRAPKRGGKKPETPAKRAAKKAKKAKKPARKAAKKTAAKTGRLARRSAADIARVGTRIVTLLKKNPDGLRSEQIRAALKLEAREMPRVLRETVAAKRIAILSGSKRSTTYGAGKARKAPAKKK